MRARLVIVMVGFVALAACAGVLGFRRSTPERFAHRKHVVAGVSCTRCHVGIDKPGPELHLPNDETCTSCHVKPHDTRSCATCHVSQTAISELVEARDHIRFDHTKHVGVAKGNCMRCHDGVADDAKRMRPPMATCFRCHDEMRDARNCAACHKNLDEEGSLPASHLAHDGDWIREHGTRAASSGDLCATCHSTQTFCAGCHGQTVPALAATTGFIDPMRGSMHRAGFASRHSLEAKSDPGACATCHTPDRCVSCHVAKGIAGESLVAPHGPGWVGITASENRHGREARRDPAACASCHGGAGEKLCVTCHAVGGVGGNPHPPGWSSRQPLSAMPCRMCHPIGTTR